MSLSFIAALALAQRSRPWGNATLHYSPDRTFDLQNIAVDLDVDWNNKTVTGHVVNTLAPLRNGLSQIHMMAAAPVVIKGISVDGSSVSYHQDGDDLAITIPGLAKGKTINVAIDYRLENANGGSFGSGRGGWHWIATSTDNPNRVGFWTQGEAEYARMWVPTWDYPNDLTTSETRTTVPADWDVVGNGLLVSTKTSSDGKRKTYDWKSTIPHATYLLTVCGGPFDIKRDTWEGVQLWYVVPKGEGNLIDDSFGDTKDMLSFYSNILGYKYPWPKYAEDAMYDFGGGMENASATTLQESALTEKREGFRRMASLNSHELGHQWFGDTVTCVNWGDIWLNESFATYMQDMYFEHSRGKNGLDRENDANIRSYVAESRQYKRPLSTRIYPSAESVFDRHAYPKGGMILHTLRRWLGDENFFAGLHLYLTTWQHTPVQSSQLCRAMTEATGINCEPFWDQWIYKPGHPVIDTTWTYDDAAGETVVDVKQTQDTSDGTPIYSIPCKVGLISPSGELTYAPVQISTTDNVLHIKSAKPAAVIFDPDHDFLREIPTLHWADSELPFILRYAPSCLDRTEAMRRLLNANPTDDTIHMIAEEVRKDRGIEPTFPNVRALANLKREDLRPLWMSLLDHPDFDRRAEAVDALGQLPADQATTAKIRSLITPEAPIQVVVNSINALSGWDAKGNVDVFQKALAIPSRRNRIHFVAQTAIDKANGK